MTKWFHDYIVMKKEKYIFIVTLLNEIFNAFYRLFLGIFLSAGVENMRLYGN